MPCRRGFTLVELCAILTVGAGGVCVGLLSQPDEALVKARQAARKVKDSTQVRGIHQAFVVWAQNNKDVYPLPSAVDMENYSVTDRGTLKDTSANIYSMLVFVGAISPEILVSPLENNANIKVYEKYEFDRPAKAAKPELALWDPGFSVDFTEGRTGGASYAHLQPSGGRLKRWSNTFSSSETVLSMRGPEVSSVQRNEDGSVLPTFANPGSNTFSMIAEGAWTGHQVCNDNRVELREEVLKPGKAVIPDPKRAKYTDAEGKSWPDLWNYDEPEDPKSVNDFLGLFTRGGGKPSEFKAIWD